ncbi:MAG: undecaprenyl diphosphate synthase family protein, partial [Actinomycetota bacterium]|nr:undecaprenyl diphosphate synthase family protein [Actinomycetota bacterium]
HERHVRIRRVGRRDGVPQEVLAEFDAAEELTASNDRMHLLVCFNYGGRAEIEDAVAAGGPEGIERNLYAPDAPDVDLLIRTSGEKRLSNFLLWQSAYAELLFTETLWPDFDRHALFDAVRDYAARNRRFGGL